MHKQPSRPESVAAIATMFVQLLPALLFLTLCANSAKAQDVSAPNTTAPSAVMSMAGNRTTGNQTTENQQGAVNQTAMDSGQSAWTKEELVTDLSLPGAPNATLEVTYAGDLKVTLGNTLTPQQTSSAPTVSLKVPVGCEGPYALLMVDPDATSRKNPVFRSWMHWMVFNINSTEKLHEGDVALPYNGPAPPKGTGLHRYVFLTYCQRGMRLQPAELAPKERKNFNLAEFVNRTNLGSPLAGNFFVAENPA
uniref:Phosphatidylethanolamine-binding protein n=1 Tax=Amblyomma maculatum TaxID=34609 RepID=G3MT91_AMBMU